MMVFYLLFILISILIDWYIIERKKHSITERAHTVRWFIRAAITSVFIYLDPIPLSQSILTYTITFWFLFDTGLNIIRGKKLYHLGTNFLDKFQKEHPNEFVWFIWKFILFLGFILAYYFN